MRGTAPTPSSCWSPGGVGPQPGVGAGGVGAGRGRTEEREGGEEDEGEIVLEVVQLGHEAVQKARKLEDCRRCPLSQSVHWQLVLV